MSNKLRYASPVKRLSKINLLCKQKSSRIIKYIIPLKSSQLKPILRQKLSTFKVSSVSLFLEAFKLKLNNQIENP